MKHEWILNCEDHGAKTVVVREGVQTLSSMQKFAKKTDFQKTMMSLMINLMGKKHEIRKLTKLFQLIDTNHDGSISLREFKSAHKQLNVFFPDSNFEEVFKSIDLNQDGVIDMDEFITATANHSKMANEHNIKQIFDMFDNNGDGKIDV